MEEEHPENAEKQLRKTTIMELPDTFLSSVISKASMETINQLCTLHEKFNTIFEAVEDKFPPPEFMNSGHAHLKLIQVVNSDKSTHWNAKISGLTTRGDYEKENVSFNWIRRHIVGAESLTFELNGPENYILRENKAAYNILKTLIKEGCQKIKKL